MSRLVDYLNDESRPVLQEVMDACKGAYIKKESVEGTYQLKTQNKVDLNAIARIFGSQQILKNGGKFSLSRFMKRLYELHPDETRNVQEILTEYYGYPIISEKEIRRKYEGRFSTFLHNVLLESEGWDEAVRQEFCIGNNMQKHKLYGHLKKAFKVSEEAALLEWEKIKNLYLVLDSFIKQNKSSIKLPILAERALGDPHGLDLNKPYRGLMVYILYLLRPQGDSYPKTSEEVMEFLADRNIYRDHISSFVTAYGLKEKRDSTINESIWQMFTLQNEPINLSLANILNVSGILAPQRVYVFENPAVFERVCPLVSTKDVALVCTFGNFKIAGLKLLDILVESNPNVSIFYSGDYDLGGLTMANRLLERYTDNLNLDLYNEEIYTKYMSDVKVDKVKLSGKVSSEHFLLKDLALIVRDNGKATYQEAFVDEIIKHIHYYS
jgi:uncharacterized protein (TIGR02679 family)